MCNRYKTKTQLAEIRVLAHSVVVLQEAEAYEPREDVRPSDEALTIWARDGDAVLGTSFWGYPKPSTMGKGLMLNARSETLATTWPWRDMVPCWLPATCWIEYVKVDGRNVAKEIGLPDGSPFLIAGVCGLLNGIRRMAMCMQEAPPRLAYLCDRLPLPYGFEAIGAKRPAQIMEQMMVV